MKVRALFVYVHRYVGLALSVPLIVVALTGSAIAFNDELEAWLSPELFVTAADIAPPLDPLVLREQVEAAVWPDARADYVPLNYQPGRTVTFALSPGPGSPPAPDHDLSPVQVFVNPATGEILGRRTWGQATLHSKDLMPFINRIHYSLALGSVGSYALGITALLWTLDCFAGLYLTLPARRRSAVGAQGGHAYWRRWWPAWQVRWQRSAFRIHFDLHRALSLWTWALLLVLAWSSVNFNLAEIYVPLTRHVLGLRQTTELPILAVPLERPRLDWRAAHEAGRRLMAEQARLGGFDFVREDGLELDRLRGTYSYTVKSTRDIGRWSQTVLVFDADSAALLMADWPGHPAEQAGDIVSRWLSWLHMVVVFGIIMQFAICAMGVVITALAFTGVYIWLRKRRGQRHARRRTLGARSA